MPTSRSISSPMPQMLGLQVRPSIAYQQQNQNPNPVLYSGSAAQNPYLQNWHPAAPQPAANAPTAPSGGGGSYGGGGGGDMGGPPPSDMKPSSGMDSASMQSLAAAMNPNRETPMLGANIGEDISPMLGKGTPRNRSGALAALAGIIY